MGSNYFSGASSNPFGNDFYFLISEDGGGKVCCEGRVRMTGLISSSATGSVKITVMLDF